MIELDGNFGEGGGQIVRTALALSMLTKQPFKVSNIRSNRKVPGLKAQHLEGIRTLVKHAGSKCVGAEIGSSEITFHPGKLKGTSWNTDIGTAGSITLLLQSLLLPCFFAKNHLKLAISGGTNVAWSMPVDYVQYVLLPQIKRFCEKISIKTIKRGHYPKGGGLIELRIKPLVSCDSFQSFEEFKTSMAKTIRPIQLKTRGNILCIKGISHASKDLENSKVAERQSSTAKSLLQKFKCPVDIRVEYSDTFSPGSGLTLWALCSSTSELDEFNPVIVGADSLGEKGTPAEDVGKAAAEKLITQLNSNAPVDVHLADNLVPWMALLPNSFIKASGISSHTKTNIYVVEKFLGKVFEVDESSGTIKTI